MWFRHQTACIFRSVKPDAVLAFAIPAACMAVLAEAFFRTEYADADATAACEFDASSNLIKPHHVRELETKGIVVIENAVTATTLRGARSNIRDFQKEGSIWTNTRVGGFAPSGNDPDVRQDLIAWVRSSNVSDDEASTRSHHVETQGSLLIVQDKNNRQENSPLGKDLLYSIQILRGIPFALEQCGYSASKNHRVPRQCQLAMYPGNGSASYERHLDQCDASVYDLGILEWLRLSDYRERAITTILYLNEPNRPESHGGALRCWVARDIDTKRDNKNRNEKDDFRPPFDVKPTGGTMVIFQSGKVDHKVLPSTEDRFALTNWVASS
jgi:hypothetical protein